MLFQRLYNWIKYKTLPPSILFKNRLFIERDSKHKRILNNFGLIFRNSKWTNYENYNIRVQFRFSFYKYLMLFFFFFFLICFLFNFKKYYIFFYFFNFLSFLFWMSFDSIDYYFSFLIWLSTIFISLFLNLIYSYFFFNNFSENSNVKKIFSHKFFSDFQMTFLKKKHIVSPLKHDFNIVFYSWLNNNSRNHFFLIEKIFEKPINLKFWQNYYNFFIKLYKSVFICAILDKKNSIFDKNFKLNKLSRCFERVDSLQLLKYLSDTCYFSNHFSLIFSYLLINQVNRFNVLILKNFTFFSHFYNWNLNILANQLKFYNFLIKSKSGLFFFRNFCFSDYVFLVTSKPEFWNIHENVAHDVTSSKWNRWLYRYSILHRKILKNSYKITLTKRLLNSGFYNTNLFNKNLWASENFLKYEKNPHTLNFFFNIYYSYFFNNKNEWHNSEIIKKNNSHFLNFINFYENSFFWFIKRFYFLNSISANTIKNKFTLKLSKNDNKFLINNYINFYFFISQSSFLSNFLFLKNFKNDHFKFIPIFSFSSNTFLQKDLFLVGNDSDVLTKDNLDVLYWICNRFFSHRNNFYYDYNLFTSNEINFSTFFNDIENDQEDHSFTIYRGSSYINDLIFFNFITFKNFKC